MFQAGTLWKLWLLSATVTLGILAAGDLAETTGPNKLVRRGKLGNNALHRRTPSTGAKQTPISAQCGDSFNNPDSSTKIPDGTVACTAYGGRPMVCSGKCEIRKAQYFNPLYIPLPVPFHLSKPIYVNSWEFAFMDCVLPLGTDKVDVYPDKFWAENSQGYIYVEGSLTPDGETKDLYKCKWNHVGAWNNQRPWCDQCVDYYFKQAPLPKT